MQSGNKKIGDTVMSHPREPKRRRLAGDSSARVGHSSHGTVSESHNSADDYFSDSEENDNLQIPSDTHAALLFLLKHFPKEGGLSRFPIILQHTIYTVIHDPGKADRELDNMLRDGIIRRFDSGTGPGETFIALSKDYNKELARWCSLNDSEDPNSSRSAASKSPSSSVSMAKGSAANVPDERKSASSLFSKFCKIAQNTCTMSITRFELESQLSYTSKSDGASSTTSKDMDAFIRELISAGFLTHQTQNISVESYFFSIPGAGLLVKNLVAGRKEMLAIICRAKYREMLKSKLMAKRLKKTCFRSDTILRDLVGSRTVLSVPTTSGALVRYVGAKGRKR